MAKSSQAARLTFSIALSVFFLYLTLFKPHIAAWWNSQESLAQALFGNSRFDVSELGHVLRDARWDRIMVAGVIFFITLTLRAWRWQKILAPLIKMPFSQVFGAMNIGYMANNLLPFRLGEVYKAQVIYQLSGLSRTQAFGTIVVERLVDLVFMVPFIGLAILMYPMPEAFKIGGLIASAGAFTLSGLCVWLGIDHDRAMKWVRVLISILPARFANRAIALIDKFASGLGVLGRRDLFWPLTLSSLALWMMYALIVYLVLDSLGLATGIELIASDIVGAVLVILFVTTFGFIIPGAPGAVGTYHGVTVLGLSLFNVPGDAAVGFALLLHALNWIPLTALGWVFFWKYGLSFKKPSAIDEAHENETNTVSAATNSP